jgi:predicted metal-dependent hydrolase
MRWRDGAALPYLGDCLTLRLNTDCKEALQAGGELHLPLPPEATARQIQDAAESWLRACALRMVTAQAAIAARQLGRDTPKVSLSFAAHGHWIQPDERGLRCHWRLIEQPRQTIVQTVERAVAALPRIETSLDLFAFA